MPRKSSLKNENKINKFSLINRNLREFATNRSILKLHVKVVLQKEGKLHQKEDLKCKKQW